MSAERTEDSALPPDVTGTVVTIGTFDGVHLGHQDVLARLAERARAVGLPSVLVTFDPHPLEVVNPGAAPLLLTVGAEKTEVLAESEVDYVVVLPFTRALAAWSAASFVDGILLARYGMRELLIGHDHGFGRGRAGDAEVLRRLGARRRFRVDVVDAVVAKGCVVSSSAIRRAVAGGDLDRAAAGLGRPFSVGGNVIHGEGRGRLLGYPTLNVALPSSRKLLPPEGVYAVRVQTPRGAFGGMMNLGPRPTFGDHRVSLEAHLFDADGDFYGAFVRVEFMERLRDTMAFSGVEALVAQIRRDETAARLALTGAAKSR